MSDLSCIPALILLNRALCHYRLKMIYFHPEKAKDKLLSLHHRALMFQKIRILIPEAKRDELEKKYAKEGTQRIGYTRFYVLNTIHIQGRRAADQYIAWYNDNMFDHMPKIKDVHETEVTDTTTVAKIGLRYPKLRPKPALPLDEGSEPEVEDESPISSTTEKESSPEEETTPSAAKDDDEELSDQSEESKDDKGEVPHRDEDSEAKSVKPSAKGPGRLINDLKDTMKGMAESLAGTGSSARTSKKRKNATTEKPALKSKKPSTRSLSRKVPPEPDTNADDSDNDGNDSATKGTEVNAVTPARPA